MAGLLTVFREDEDKVTHYIEECKRMGIAVLQPDVNKSGKGFTIEGNAIRFGLNAIKGVGDAGVERIMELRPFDSLEDMIGRCPKKALNKRTVTALALSGGLDGLAKLNHADDDVEPLFDNRMFVLQYVYMLRKDRDDLTDRIRTYSNKIRLEDEKQYLGFYLSGHPLADLAERVNWDNLADNEPVDTAGIITSFQVIKTKRGDDMAMINIDTMEGNKRIVVFPNEYMKLDVPLAKDLLIKVTCYLKFNPQYNEKSIIVKKITIPKRINKAIIQQAQLEALC